QAFAGSKTLPRPCAATGFAFGPRRHWPFKSGYFDSSNADAPAMVASSAAASTDRAIEPRYNITVLLRSIFAAQSLPILDPSLRLEKVPTPIKKSGSPPGAKEGLSCWL